MKFCWFHKFLFYDLYFEFHSLNVLNIYYSTNIFIFVMNISLQQHFYSHLFIFLCSLLSCTKSKYISGFNSTSSSTAASTSNSGLIFPFSKNYLIWMIIVFWLSRIISKIKHFFIAAKIFIHIFSFNFIHWTISVCE